jgi:uncharacterized protein YbjT (DUF2867 family)
MRVAVAGGTGVVGAHTVEALARHGHEPVVLARSRGVDLTTGRGLDEALAGVQAVVDASNIATLNRAKAREFFDAATTHLLEAGARAGVGHHVLLSIVGVDRVDTGYYAAKVHQEELVRRGAVPYTILRATQFHEFAGQLLRRSRGPVGLVPRMRVQPVAAADVGEHLAGLAVGDPAGATLEMAGPEVHDLVPLARRVAARIGHPRFVLPVPVPGAAGRAMAHGALLPRGPATIGPTTFDGWLATV